MGKIRFVLLFTAATFVAAALIHSGVLITGYEHDKARVAESVIAIMLFVGALVTWIQPAWTRQAALAAMGFALLGTFVGVFTIIVGVGPRSVPDVTYHFIVVAILVWGLISARRIQAVNTTR
jgi:hypothetical protein